ncbi:MAG: hypothetical protein NVS2B14_06270 [Chamaesiphon sp.]
MPGLLNLETFCQEILIEFKLIFGQKHMLDLNLYGEDLECEIDEKILRTIVNNLLSNAIKYSPQGSTIKFNVFGKQEQAIFEIKDSGIGIPEADKEQLFNAFHRATNVGTISGTGLGLAIAKKAVDLHRGKITFESEVGVGTTFTVYLPNYKKTTDQ